MSFARLETLLVVAALAGAVTAVALAAAGTGAWAIIGQQLAMATVGSALMWSPTFGILLTRSSSRRKPHR